MPARAPKLLAAGLAPAFPDPSQYDDEGLVAVGGDLSSASLLSAYRHGIFPWYNEGLPILWWSPNPRAVITAQTLHVSRSLQRTLNRAAFCLTWNQDFAGVIEHCAQNRAEGTWIVPEMKQAYLRLHSEGHAHSVEVWRDARLVGGLYGVRCGGLFAAESMFHTATDASKVALVEAVQGLYRQGVELMDVQFLTPHLRSMGAHAVERPLYLKWVTKLRDRSIAFPSLVP